jgi:hypothetical protein
MKLSKTINQTRICKKSYDDPLGYFCMGFFLLVKRALEESLDKRALEGPLDKRSLEGHIRALEGPLDKRALESHWIKEP